jgi:hypothetical protein
MEDNTREELLKALFEFTNKIVHKDEKGNIVTFEVFKSRQQNKSTRELQLLVQSFRQVFPEL